MFDASLSKATYRIVVVGDIHNQWTGQDEQALSSLEPDLVLFVGDFGNESLETVRQVAQLPFPKAIAYGNHDAWYTATPWGQKRCPLPWQSPFSPSMAFAEIPQLSSAFE